MGVLSYFGAESSISGSCFAGTMIPSCLVRLFRDACCEELSAERLAFPGTVPVVRQPKRTLKFLHVDADPVPTDEEVQVACTALPCPRSK